MRVKLSSPSGDFTAEQKDGVMVVVADDPDDTKLAAIAQRHAQTITRLRYTPALGEPFALFVKVAASVLGAKVVGSIPPGEGELEKSLTGGDSDKTLENGDTEK